MDQNTPGATAPTKVHAGGRLSKDRYILQQLVTKDFKLRYRRSVLGVVWSVLNPLLMMIIMSFVFQYFLRSNLEHYSLYLIVGNITFALMNDATNGGLRSIIDKMGSRDFSRIRTGIGNPPGKMAVADYVLKQLRAREAEDFQDTCARAADAAGLAIVHGVIYARDHVNGAASANGKH